MRHVPIFPWTCAALHGLGLAALVMVSGGTEAEPDVARRARFIAEHPVTWRVAWVTWMLAALSLVGFYAWWGARLRRRRAAAAGVLLAACGMAFDLGGESIFVLGLVERALPVTAGAGAWDAGAFLAAQRLGTLLTAGAANALYTLGGAVLTAATPGLPRVVDGAMWTTWAAGAAMTVCALLDSATGIAVATAVLFPLLIAWTVWMALSWRRP